jgi:hypothetical protein
MTDIERYTRIIKHYDRTYFLEFIKLQVDLPYLIILTSILIISSRNRRSIINSDGLFE